MRRVAQRLVILTMGDPLAAAGFIYRRDLRPRNSMPVLDLHGPPTGSQWGLQYAVLPRMLPSDPSRARLVPTCLPGERDRPGSEALRDVRHLSPLGWACALVRDSRGP